MNIKLELTIKEAEQLNRILRKYYTNNATGIESDSDKAYAKTLEDRMAQEINIAKIDEYTDKLC